MVKKFTTDYIMFNTIQTNLTHIFSILLDYSNYLPSWGIDLVIIFYISLLLNILFYLFILSGGFSYSLKIKFIYLLQNNINLFIVIPFILYINIYILSESSNILLEDPKVVITATVKDTEIILTGNALNSIFLHLGSAGVFAAGARIAASIVSKKLHLVPRLGIIGSSGLGFTATYQMLLDNLPNTNKSGASPAINIKTGPFKIDIKSLEFLSAKSDTEKVNVLQKAFTDNIASEVKPVVTSQSDTLSIKGDQKVSSSVLDKLEQVEPNWKDKFISNSPIENSEAFLQFISNQINNNLYLHFAIFYLLVMLLIIFTSKWAIDNNIQFNWLKSTAIGKFFHSILMKYLSAWKNNAHIWIFYILMCLIFFTCVSIYSFYQVLTALEILSK